MEKLKLILLIFVQLLFIYSIVAPSCLANEKYMIKFASVAPDGSIWIKHMRRLDKTLLKKSQGQIGFRIYPGGIAGDELDVLRKIRIGQIHSAAFSGVGIAQILPMVRILDLPFLFRNQKEIKLMQEELEEHFAVQFQQKGFEFLAWAEVGNVHLFSKKPIQKVDDLAGLRVWTWSGDPISKETFSAMGTNPIPLSITDVTTSLNTGMIDTVYAPPLGALALQWHTQVQYMTALPLAHATGVVLISNKYFKKIPVELAELLKEELELTMANLSSDLDEQAQQAIRLIQESGIHLTPLPPQQELDKFYKVHSQVAKKLAGKQYPQELLDRVYRVLDRSRKTP